MTAMRAGMWPEVRAEVDQSFAFAGLIPGIHGPDPDFHFERRRDAVAGFVAVILVILPVRVDIDEARRHDQAFGLNGLLAPERFRRNNFDLTGGDADVADSIQTGVRIHDVAVGNHKVKLLGCSKDRKPRGNEKQQRQNSHKSDAGFFAGPDELLDVDEVGRVVAGVAGVAVFVACVSSATDALQARPWKDRRANRLR